MGASSAFLHPSVDATLMVRLVAKMTSPQRLQRLMHACTAKARVQVFLVNDAPVNFLDPGTGKRRLLRFFFVTKRVRGGLFLVIVLLLLHHRLHVPDDLLPCPNVGFQAVLCVLDTVPNGLKEETSLVHGHLGLARSELGLEQPNNRGPAVGVKVIH